MAESHDDFLARMRLLAEDHEPDGWPAIRMRDITRLCDMVGSVVPAIDRLQERLEAGCQIMRQDGLWHLVDAEGRRVCMPGATVRNLMLNLVWQDC